MTETEFRPQPDPNNIPHANGTAPRLVLVGGTVPGQREPIRDHEEIEHEQPVPVDADPRTDPTGPAWARETRMHPIVPGWVLDSAQREAAARWALRWTAHATAFHALRAPKYIVRASWYGLRGASRALVGWLRWVFDWDARTLRRDLIERSEATAYYTAARHRDQRVKNRAIGSGIALLGAGIAAGVGYAFWHPTPILLAATAFGALVWQGRPIDAPFLFDRTVTPAHIARLTSDVVAKALGSLGIAELRKAVERMELAFTAPIQRDGDGWRAEIDLPHGIAAVDVIEKRVALSSGLRRPLGCVWPEPVEDEHSGHLVLWVGDRPLSKQPALRYPLLERGKTSLFEPLPFGTDQRGREQNITLMFASMAVGAQPRMGKTFGVRLLALGAALDPTCELHVYDGKGMGDYVMFESVAHSFLSGSKTDTLLALRDDLLDIKEEVERRADLLTELTRKGRCKEGKVTPELAKDSKLGLHPIVIILDECHLAFDTGSGKAKALGEEITELAEYIVRVGPAGAVSLLASTQRPDGKSLPTGIRANVQLRYSLKVADQPTNDMVLGTSAYKNGVRATEFGLKDKGIGYLVGEGAEPIIVRTYYVDADDAQAIVNRARALREQAGTLTGLAAGIAPTRRADPGELLMDVLAAMGSEDQMWSEAVCEQLAEDNPGRYAGWDAPALGKALKAQGVTTKQTWWTPPNGTPGNKNGIRREQLNDVLAKLRAKNDGTGR
jgi:S-DNA-T family DNA segregation ATPase FtsK/SpoIIIE